MNKVFLIRLHDFFQVDSNHHLHLLWMAIISQYSPPVVRWVQEVFMRAYLVQHGKAVSAEEDPNRSLTDEGREDVRRVARFLCEQRISVSLIMHSGKSRAEETAHILAGNLRVAAGPNHTDGL